PAAWRLVLAVRQGRFRDPGRLTRGPLGLGTDFESIREYLPDDDFRQVNWRATARMGRPMSNQYRVEQDRDVVCMLDAGRLMAARLEDAAAQPLLDAMPVLTRRHAVVVAGVTDPDLEQMVHSPPRSPADVYTAAVALDVLDARARVAAQLRRAGADVVEA